MISQGKLQARRASAVCAWLCLLATDLWAQAALPAPAAPAAEREVMKGISTRRPIQGMPYELAGKRVVFTNWYYIQPGDLDWRDESGKSVYVSGDSGAFGPRHVSINAPRGIRIVAEKPEVMKPFERPHRMLIQEGQLYKGWTDSDYYESTDAIHWTKKAALKLGEGSPDSLYQIFSDPSAPAAERYKAVWTALITRAQFEAFRKQRPEGWEPRALLHLGERDEVSCLRGGTSADGVHWTVLPDPLVVEYCDTWNTAYYDAPSREYVIYTRYWSIGPQSDRLPADIRNSWTGVGRRAIGRTASRDFRQFHPSELLLEPTPDMLPSEQLYTNCHTTIPGAPDQHLMFPTLWNGSINDTTRVLMASSHDGKTWHWVPGGDILHTGPFGRYDGGDVWATPELIELPSGDFALPFLSHIFPHKYPRGQNVGSTSYAVWPKGRIVALDAPDRGEFTMIPLIAAGKSLKINALTQRAGWIKVEAVGVEGRKLDDCVPLVGDQYNKRIAWKSGDTLGVPAGKPVTLRIELNQARLYGLEFE